MEQKFQLRSLVGRVSEGAKLTTCHCFGDGERVTTQHVDVIMDVRVEVRNVRFQNEESLSTQLLDRRLHVQGVPQYDHIDHQPERTELIFLALPIALA